MPAARSRCEQDASARILSHAHLDHFDIPTLATLPRDADVLCPKDKVILYALEQLGFQKIHATDPMARIDFKSHTLLTTHSNVTNVVEFGVVFKDRSDTFWNHVDTVIAPATVTSTLGLEEDTYRLRFDPTASVPPLVDVNPEGHTRERLQRDVEECMRAFGELVAKNTDDDVLRDYRASGVSYAVGVVFPDGTEWIHRVDFTATEPVLSRGDAMKDTATVVHRIAASAVVSWLARDKSYFYLRAFSRRSSALYALSGAGTPVRVEPKVLPDLFERFLRRHVKGAELAQKTWLDRQLAPYRNAR